MRELGQIQAQELERLPIFPLPDAVLFPGSILPLHVFEPRYVEMTTDVLAGSRLMGIVNLAGDEDDDLGRPAVHEIATVGEVVDSQQLPDGRYGLLVRGLGRIRIEREHPPQRTYRQVEARLLESDEGVISDTALAQLVTICDQLSMHVDDGGDKLRELVRSSKRPGTLSDAVASALVGEADERQKLLETLDPAERVTLLVAHVSGLLAELSPRSDLLN